MLKRNFDRSYFGKTRAPFGLYLHAAWFFGQQHHYDAYVEFLDFALSHDDVWIVPIHAGLEYAKNPVTNEELVTGTLPAFNCDDFPDNQCERSSNCR